MSNRGEHRATGRAGAWAVAVAGSLIVLSIILLIRASVGASGPLAEPIDPNGINTVIGWPTYSPSPPATTASGTAPTPTAAATRPEPPEPTPAIPWKRPVTTPTSARPPRPPAPPPPPTVTSYEAESFVNSLTDTKIYTCYGCSGDKKVGRIGAGMGTLQFNGVGATEGSATLTLVYVNGEDTRVAQLTVNGVPVASLSFPGTGGWSTVGRLSIAVRLRAGANTFRLSNSYSAAPDFDRIIVSVPAR